MIDLIEVENYCLEHLKIDYMPLHDIVREFSGFEKLTPNEGEFYNVLEFLEFFLKKHNIKYSLGPGGEIINKSNFIFIKWLKNKWKNNEYDEISYGVWFQH
jgi:hypothetical protein